MAPTSSLRRRQTDVGRRAASGPQLPPRVQGADGPQRSGGPGRGEGGVMPGRSSEVAVATRAVREVQHSGKERGPRGRKIDFFLETLERIGRVVGLASRPTNEASGVDGRPLPSISVQIWLFFSMFFFVNEHSLFKVFCLRIKD